VGESVTINFSNDVSKATGVFYVPVPLGTYGSVTAEILDGDQTIATRTWSGQTVKRKIPKRGTMDVDYVAEINGALYQSLQAAIDAAEGQVINVDHDLVLEEPVVLAPGMTATIDLNGNTISGTATSASASSLVSVRSGADLTIMDGTVIFAAATPDTQWGGEGQPPYPGYANNTIRNEGVLTLENVYLENKTMKGGASYVIDNYNGARLTINDGCTDIAPQFDSEKVSATLLCAEDSREFTTVKLDAHMQNMELVGVLKIKAYDKKYRFTIRVE
jgi:hypothetical protein